MKKELLGGIVLLISVLGIVYLLNNLENYKKVYYTQIDNSKIQEITSSDMKYEYTLKSYDEKGKEKELKFKTSRELKNEAFLELEVRLFGVHKWQEIQFYELPLKVQNVYSK